MITEKLQEDNQEESLQTKRVTSPGLEEILYKSFPVLDHGFIRVVDYMGDDAAVVQAARVSYGKGTKKRSQDRGLIRYLLRHYHTTPFEMCDIKLHVKMPIFVARQWLRHRTASVNEYSARYSILDKEFYLPSPETIAAQSSSNMQGREGSVSAERAAEVLSILKEDATRCYSNYIDMMNWESNSDDLAEKYNDSGREVKELDGVNSLSNEPIARELARVNLNLSYYTQFYWKINLHNLLHFIRLRADSHAQYEIRAYAEILLNEILKRWVPLVYEAYSDYRHNSISLSAQEYELLQSVLSGKSLDESKTQLSSALSARELTEFLDKFPSLRS